MDDSEDDDEDDDDEYGLKSFRERCKQRKQAKAAETFGYRTRRSNPGRRVIHGRIYDSELGTTCHQCRQKTMNKKVQCTNEIIDPLTGEKSMCTLMMDEPCLLGRYGETVEEVSENRFANQFPYALTQV